MSVCIAILNFNGRKHLLHLLPTAIEAAKRYSDKTAVVVLDNQSTDDDLDWIHINFPSVEVVTAPKNDYLYSYNWFAETRTEEVLVFLNNDLKVSPDFIIPLVQHFKTSDVFAVSATSRNWDDTAWTWGSLSLKDHHGLYYWEYDPQQQDLKYTLFCSGGFMAVNRLKFLEIGGFNRLFWPAYGEDLDLCFRAWRKGWSCLVEPKSIVYHREHGSFNISGPNRTRYLMIRSQLLFQWSSLPATKNWIERFLFQIYYCLGMLAKGDSLFLTTWFKTWFEWRRLKSKYKYRKATLSELNAIKNKILLASPFN